MCIVFIAIDAQANPGGFSVLANRDEFVARPTATAYRWPDANGLIGGQDLEAGGTWLGVNDRGRFAAVTNVRAPGRFQSGMRSRGDLVTQWMTGNDTVAQFSAALAASATQYNPFNLVFGERQTFALYDGVTETILPLEPGVHAISNGSSQSPWPKMQTGLSAFESAMPVDRDQTERMLRVARDDRRADDAILPNTGIPNDIERQLSSIFIPEGDLAGRQYGTVSTTLVDWRDEGGFLQEWNWRSGAEAGPTTLSW